MKHTNQKQKLILSLVLFALTLSAFSILMFWILNAVFSGEKLFYYAILSLVISIYAWYLMNRKAFFSTVFFIIAYVLCFFALHYNAKSSGINFSDFTVVFISLVVLLSVSLIGVLIDTNLSLRKKEKRKTEITQEPDEFI